MNPEEAYRAQTNWARAAGKEGSNHQRWFTEQAKRHCTPLTPMLAEREEVRSTSGQQAREPMLARQILSGSDGPDGMWAMGPVVETNLILDWEMHTDRSPTSPLVDEPTDVYEPEPDVPAAGSVHAQALVIPEKIYTDGSRAMLGAGDTFYVTADMVSVMEVAAAAFDQFDQMPRLPAPCGFVVLARPIEVPDFDGVQSVYAFGWTSWGTVVTTLGQNGMTGEVWSFSSRKRPADFHGIEVARAEWSSKTAWRNDPDLLPVYADRFITGDRIGPIVEDIAVTEGHQSASAQVRERWRLARETTGDDMIPTPEEWEDHLTGARALIDQEVARARQRNGGPKMVGRMQPYLAAFILLLTQKITAPITRTVEPSDARLAATIAPRRSSSVTVVDVRAAARRAAQGEDPDGEAGGVGRHRRPLDHRHLVGAHWKWQPYGKERSLRRRILVTGYVRGPEDKPLRVTPRVTRL